ncbi:hypothetical protein [Sandaracinus amylolyticus]|uniref:hypothetical protein n=1 Tax=Sandaracinus amylolyticus TaxID=927083 RepID=UPI001F19321E|nr:hypothetical protein [Sandaracinus amylolyticus]UJR83341.1 Hypothetical protein I5071_54090 [Sandaracinus amylolyticus]
MKVRTATWVALAIAAYASACEGPYEREMGIGREGEQRSGEARRRGPEGNHGDAVPAEDALIDQRTILENEPLEESEPTRD